MKFTPLGMNLSEYNLLQSKINYKNPLIMKKLVFFILSLGFLQIQAQATAIEWQNTIGGSGDDILYSVSQTSDGGYILGGRA
ncbi:MAG: hypothetical protein ACI8V8_001529, partial [Chitinophagales bacterium]